MSYSADLAIRETSGSESSSEGHESGPVELGHDSELEENFTSTEESSEENLLGHMGVGDSAGSSLAQRAVVGYGLHVSSLCVGSSACLSHLSHPPPRVA